MPGFKVQFEVDVLGGGGGGRGGLPPLHLIWAGSCILHFGILRLRCVYLFLKSWFEVDVLGGGGGGRGGRPPLHLIWAGRCDFAFCSEYICVPVQVQFLWCV